MKSMNQIWDDMMKLWIILLLDLYIWSMRRRIQIIVISAYSLHEAASAVVMITWWLPHV